MPQLNPRELLKCFKMFFSLDFYIFCPILRQDIYLVENVLCVCYELCISLWIVDCYNPQKAFWFLVLKLFLFFCICICCNVKHLSTFFFFQSFVLSGGAQDKVFIWKLLYLNWAIIWNGPLRSLMEIVTTGVVTQHCTTVSRWLFWWSRLNKNKPKKHQNPKMII